MLLPFPSFPVQGALDRKLAQSRDNDGAKLLLLYLERLGFGFIYYLVNNND